MNFKFLPVFLAMGLALTCVNNAKAQNYSQPNRTVPAWEHANTQSLHSIEVTSNNQSLLSYTTPDRHQAYNWLQEEKMFTIAPGQSLTIDTRAGIWCWDIELGFDWDGDGTFETRYRAFSPIDEPVSQANSSWGIDPWRDSNYRREEEKRLGHIGVLHHVFNITVPANAKEGTTRMRVLCDGDGFNGGGIPPFNIDSSVGYAGSMTDFGITVDANSNTTTGITAIKENTTNAILKGIYTLDGVKMNKPFNQLAKGIYVINGKKVIKN